MKPFLCFALGLLILGCEKRATTTTSETSTYDTAVTPEPGAPAQDAVVDDGSAPSTTGNTGRPTGDDKNYISGNIRVTRPTADQYVRADQFVIEGEARTFENNVQYRVKDLASSRIIAQGFTTATGEMGTFSPFSIRVEVSPGVQYPTRALVEVFESSAKDGSEINKVQIPIRLGQGEAEPNAIEIFFSNARKGSATNCSKVFSLPRSILETRALATTALRKLLEGPTPEERAEGYETQIPPGTRLNKVVVSNGVATADFSSELNSAAGSCRVTAIRSQIERTLKQFSTVSRVVISVNGETKEVLQP